MRSDGQAVDKEVSFAINQADLVYATSVCLGGRNNFPDLSFGRRAAEADVVEAGGDQAGGDDGEEGDEEEEGAAGGGGLDGRAVEGVHRGGGDARSG